MRRSEREITDFDQMLAVVESCDCCRLGLVTEEGAYIVPLNFGYEARGGELTLYFHSAPEGRKIELLKRRALVSFEMDARHELVCGGTACACSYRYQCVMGQGRAELLESFQEKLLGLQQIMVHTTGRREWSFQEDVLRRTAVIRLRVNRWSCKAH